ncbi:hypothetical protein P152DRAFT_393336 [Eremomyces bilateralis CBS 781.70]|uniref:DNA-directed RNA polymerase subunit n=1 Tax=Eremomyces bilateralis CBS 781.70 TaxID=1392243 RepID=A0A6G1G8G3_9PEZI|nr:uncharacterized protein P152DRAFT_393336 [Eremomyces bilateralis CBS 781.70]KAF1814190.1 hypothetical protein P152DRAFT_393336 [Eremomyces bilateralis CBS 781.70]
MTSIGSCVFCTACGSLLDKSTEIARSVLDCGVCGTKNKDTSAKVIITRSKDTAFPSALRAKRSEVQKISEDDLQQDALIDETCDKCGREQVRYHTVQLRSADEGSTIFYNCDCGHSWNTNN